MKNIIYILFISHYSLLIATAQWVQMSNGMSSTVIYSLAASGNAVFAGAGDYYGVYKSTNYGANWSQTHLNNQIVLSLAATGNNIFAGATSPSVSGIYVSINNGSNWIRTYIDNDEAWSIAINGNNTFAGTLGGVYLTTNNGTNWTHTTLQAGSIFSLAITASIVFAGSMESGVHISTNNGTTWTQTSLNNRSVHSLAINGNTVFAGTNYYGVYLSTNNGSTWTQTSLNDQYANSLCVNGNNIFVGTEYHGLFVSNDNGASWTQRNEGLSGNPIQALCMLNNYIFAGTFGNRVFRRPLSELIGIQPISEQIPSHFALEQNYPNPFNPTTKIRFALPKSSFAKLVVYDILGREVESLVNEQLNAGTYEADWNAVNYPSGVYYYKLTAGDFTETRKAVLIK